MLLKKNKNKKAACEIHPAARRGKNVHSLSCSQSPLEMMFKRHAEGVRGSGSGALMDIGHSQRLPPAGPGWQPGTRASESGSVNYRDRDVSCSLLEVCKAPGRTVCEGRPGVQTGWSYIMRPLPPQPAMGHT